MKFEVQVTHLWTSSKSLHFELEAEDEESARDEALSEARNSDVDDWGDTRTDDFQEQIEDIQEIKDGS